MYDAYPVPSAYVLRQEEEHVILRDVLLDLTSVLDANPEWDDALLVVEDQLALLVLPNGHVVWAVTYLGGKPRATFARNMNQLAFAVALRMMLKACRPAQ